MFNRAVEPGYREMRKNAFAQISAGKPTEDSELAVEIKTVRDFLWLCRAIDFQRQRKSDQTPD
jgi:hypothetical protein